MSTSSPSWAADYMERQAEKALCHEREMNAFVERKNPHLKPTSRYLATALPEHQPLFYTRTAELDWLRRRELGKHNPNYTNY